MKILIREGQLDGTIQKMFDETLNKMRTHCDNPYAETFPEWMGFDDCDSLESLESIKVIDSRSTKTKGRFPRLDVYVHVYFSSIFQYVAHDDLISSIRYRIHKTYKLDLNIIIDNEENINKNREW